MTPNRTNIRFKLLTLCLIAALLWGATCGYEAFLGPGISDAAAAADLETVTETEVIVPPTASITATTKHVNFMVYVRVLRTDITYLDYYITDNDDAVLKYYDTSVIDEDENYVLDYEVNRLEAVFTPATTYSTNTLLFKCAYDSTASVTNAFNAVSARVNGGSTTAGNATISSGATNVITLEKVLMGDIDQNGTVDSTDALMAIQAGVGIITLSDVQKDVGDVNGDGAVDAQDNLKITNYSNGSILSFWDETAIVPISVPSTAPIESGLIYSLKNAETSSYLTSSPNSTYAGTNANLVNGSYSTNLMMTYTSGGICTIKSLLNNGYLGVNSSGKFVYTTSPNTGTHQWRVVPGRTTGSFYLVNKANPGYLLTSDGSLGREINSTWSFEETVHIKYNYNFGYRYRMGSDAAAQAELTEKQGQVAGVLKTVFDISIKTQAPGRWYSREDKCYAPNSSPTAAQMIATIGADEVADYNKTSNPYPCPKTHCTDPVCEKGSGDVDTHQRNASEGLDYYNSKRLAGPHNIWLLTSGYMPCSLKDTNDDDVDDTHAYGVIGGLANSSLRVAGVYHADSGNEYKNTIAALHEISHCLGALKSTNCPADTDHGECVMSYDSTDGYLLELFNGSAGMKELLFCVDCYDTVVEFIKYY